MNTFPVVLLHNHPEYMVECSNLLNEEWPRSETARLLSLQASSDELPTSLILLDAAKKVIGHCKLTPIPNIPESCFVESMVIGKEFRGKRLGSYLMSAVEKYCRDKLQLRMVHLSTRGQEVFYKKLGYEVCEPVSIYGGLRRFNRALNFTIHENTTNYMSQPDEANETKKFIPPPPPPPPPPYVKKSTKKRAIKQSKTFMVKHINIF